MLLSPAAVYHPIVCRETTAWPISLFAELTVYHPIVCRETTARRYDIYALSEFITLLSVGKPRHRGFVHGRVL